MRTAGLGLLVAIVVAAHPGAQQLPPQPRPGAALDYETFKTRVQPILMAARKGNARCLSCHARGGGNSYLEPLAPGAATYTEEQTRRNFERIQKLVVPGEPLKSILLINPLAEEAGGSHWHGGGKHWQSQENPEWRTLAEWVRSPSARRCRRRERCARIGGAAASSRGKPARLQRLPDEGRADSDGFAQGQCAMPLVPLARRRQRIPRAAAGGEPARTRRSSRAATSSASRSW